MHLSMRTEFSCDVYAHPYCLNESVFGLNAYDRCLEQGMAEILKCQDASGAKLKSSNTAVNDSSHHMPASSVDITKKGPPAGFARCCMRVWSIDSSSVNSSPVSSIDVTHYSHKWRVLKVLTLCLHAFIEKNRGRLVCCAIMQIVCAVVTSPRAKVGLDTGCTTSRTLPAAHIRLWHVHESCF